MLDLSAVSRGLRICTHTCYTPAAPGGGAGGAAAAAARAQAFERGNDYARAVEAYLSPPGEGAAAAELDALQRCWEGALAVAGRHLVSCCARGGG